MPGTTEFLPFATDSDAAVEAQATYASALYRSKGFTAGVLTKEKLNKAVRQATVIAWAVSQAMANATGVALADDGDTTALLAQVTAALDLGLRADMASSSGVALLGYLAPYTGAGARTLEDVLGDKVSLKSFDGVTGVDGEDQSAGMEAARLYCAANAPMTLHVPKGVYCSSDFGNWAISGLTLWCDAGAVFKCTSTTPGHTALNFWAFEGGQRAFVQKLTIRGNLHVTGNANTLYGVRAYGLARCDLDVRYTNGDPVNGCAFQYNACSSNTFKIICSTDADPGMTSVPYYGVRLDTGIRSDGLGGTEGLGSSTNNHFPRPLIEGVAKGWEHIASDQNLIEGGTTESCTASGVHFTTGARMNLYKAHAMEANAGYDVRDEGKSNHFDNCYGTSTTSLFYGEGAMVVGGLWQLIAIQAGAKDTVIENLLANYVGGGAGVTDAGTNSSITNVRDAQTGNKIIILKNRAALTVTASPFTWVNDTEQWVELIYQSGTMTSVTRSRNGVPFDCPTSSKQLFPVGPGETVVTTYTGPTPPAMSILPMTGFKA